MDAYEALKETFDDLFQQAVEEGCYTEDEAAELVESLDIYSLLQVVRHNATTVYSYITQGRQERSFNYRGEDLFRQKATLLYEETDQVTMEIVVATRTLELWLLEDMSLAVVSCVSVNYDHDGYITQYLTRRQLRGKNGRITDTEYTIFEKPVKPQPEPAPPDTASPGTENPDMVNPDTSKTYPTSFVVTDPKGSILIECGKMLQKFGYRIRFLNTINMKKSMHYNPFA